MNIINRGRYHGKDVTDAIMKEHDAGSFIVWADTPYKTGKCQHCGHRVRSETGEPEHDVRFYAKEQWFICPECYGAVARLSADPDIRVFMMIDHWKTRKEIQKTPRYIDAGAAWKRFYEISKEQGFHPSDSAWSTEYVLDFIKSRDTADVEEVRHGGWKHICASKYECSLCGDKEYMPGLFSNYCPNCGAKMDLKGEAEK